MHLKWWFNRVYGDTRNSWFLWSVLDKRCIVIFLNTKIMKNSWQLRGFHYTNSKGQKLFTDVINKVENIINWKNKYRSLPCQIWKTYRLLFLALLPLLSKWPSYRPGKWIFWSVLQFGHSSRASRPVALFWRPLVPFWCQDAPCPFQPHCPTFWYKLHQNRMKNIKVTSV